MSQFPYFHDFYATFRAPFSGDVVQHIEPRVLSPDIAGDAEVEARIHHNVASYGKQLGKVLEALAVLARKAEVDLPDITDLIENIEAEKTTRRETLKCEAREALERLGEVDANEMRKVLFDQPEL